MTEYEFQQRQFQLGANPAWQETAWQNAAEHRSVVTRILITETNQKRDSVAILGAGRCNDISLKVLREWYHHVHLFDIDGDAVWKGVDFQGFAGADWITIHGDFDISGVRSLVPRLAEQPPAQETVDGFIRQAREFRIAGFSRQFDVVCSTCVLSQIIEHTLATITEDHPRVVDILSALRAGHILMLADLCKPDGTANLVTDFVSSQTLPGLEGFKGEALNRLLSQAIQQRNFFHGLNPMKIMDVMMNDPGIAPGLTKVRGSNTWVWNATELQYAVTAFQFKPA